MTRDEIRKILGENATEEQITNTLNAIHNNENNLKKQVQDLQSNLDKYSDYDSIKTQLDEINKAKMTEQEKLEAEKKEVAKQLHEAKILTNKAKVKEILATRDFDDEIIDSIVSEDIDSSISKAQKLANKYDSIIAETKKKTEEDIANMNVKPNLPTSNPNDSSMTFEKFSKLSAKEQNEWMEQHPTEFESL